MTLVFERSGKTREVAEFRRDGWPICPSCDEDELAAVAAVPATPAAIDLCYRCGPVTVLDATQPPAGAGREEG